MKNITSLRYLALLFFIIHLVFVDHFLFSPEIFALSPQFSLQEITSTNVKLPWFDLKTHKASNNGDPSTYIPAVNYFSNGKVLNATLWLLEPFQQIPRTQISYGILIDADNNNNTGYYNFEINSNNKIHTWNKVVEKWSPVPFGEFSTMVLTNQSNYTGFFEKGKGFISLSLDLSSILYPKKYKVLFYAETKTESADLVYFTKWVQIPPPQINISTNPRSLDLDQGDGEKNVEVIVNSTASQESVVHLSTGQTGPEDIKPSLTYSVLPIPSFGIATTSLRINASEHASIKPYTLFISANSYFPKQVTKNAKPQVGLAKPLAFFANNNSVNEPIFNHTSITINVHEAPSTIDQINELWTKLGSPVAFVYGIIAGISPWIYRSIRDYSKKRGKNK